MAGRLCEPLGFSGGCGGNRMTYCWTTILVGSLEASIAFYRDIVGLPVTRRFTAGSDTEIAFLGEGETQVELIETRRDDVVVGNGISLGFAVDDLDRMIDFVGSKGIAVESGPFRPNEHVRFFFVLDPNGVRVQFSESV